MTIFLMKLDKKNDLNKFKTQRAQFNESNLRGLE